MGPFPMDWDSFKTIFETATDHHRIPKSNSRGIIYTYDTYSYY